MCNGRLRGRGDYCRYKLAINGKGCSFTIGGVFKIGWEPCRQAFRNFRNKRWALAGSPLAWLLACSERGQPNCVLCTPHNSEWSKQIFFPLKFPQGLLDFYLNLKLQAKEKKCRDRPREETPVWWWRVSLRAREHRGRWQMPEAGRKAWTRPSRRASGGNPFCQHLGFRLPASRTVRETCL